MAVRLRCQGREGRHSVLAEERWTELTQGRRSLLLQVPGIDGLICRAIAQRDIGTFDQHGWRCHYLDLRQDAPIPAGRWYLRVCVDHRLRWIDRIKRRFFEDTRGDVEEIDIVANVQERETRWWPPAM